MSNPPPRLPKLSEIADVQTSAQDGYTGYDSPASWYRWCRIAMGVETHPWGLVPIMYGGGEAPGYLDLTTRQVYSTEFHPVYDPVPEHHSHMGVAIMRMHGALRVA